MTVELKSYNIETAELLIIAKCIQDNPKLSGPEISRLLGIGKSSFYRKIKVIDTDSFRIKLLEAGYTLSAVQITHIN